MGYGSAALWNTQAFCEYPARRVLTVADPEWSFDLAYPLFPME
jgi:hypothetical protein